MIFISVHYEEVLKKLMYLIVSQYLCDYMIQNKDHFREFMEDKNDL